MKFHILFLFFLKTTLVFGDSPSVVIVGAGAAGISTATKLLENSITNITIVEAENRIGGRINTIKFGGGYVDLGAQYCHGEKGNTVYEITKNVDVLQHTTQFDTEYVRLYSSNGERVDDDLCEFVLGSAYNYEENIRVVDGLSLGQSFLEKYNKTILQKYGKDQQKLKTATDAIDIIHHLILTHEGSFSWDSPASGRHYEECPGDQSIIWKVEGYKTILKILMKSYPDDTKKLPIDDKILLGKEVKKINWEDKNVEVHLDDGSVLTADHVIFTPSVGVLKSKNDEIFKPNLPQEKLKALEAIGLEGVMKIVFHFPEKWWGDDDGIFFFLWSKEDLKKSAQEFPEGPKKDGVSWIAQISAVVKAENSPNSSIAWVSGELVPQIEKTPDEILKKGISYLLKKFLQKDYNVTSADQLIKTQWATNPHFLGTYSFEKVGHFKEDVSYQNQLAAPLVNKNGKMAVLFAGEATDPIHYSTVHGAIDSGRREADRIISLYKQAK